MIIKNAHKFWSFRFAALSTMLASVSTYLAMMPTTPHWLTLTVLALTIASGVLGAVSRFIKQMTVEEAE